MLTDLHHLIHAPQFQAKPLSALFFAFTLRMVAISLVAVFIPVYIVNLTGDFVYVLWYLAAFSFFTILLAIPLGWVVNYLGFRRSVLASSLALVGYFLLLESAAQNPILIYAVSFLEAVKLLLFWIPYHLIFLEDGDHKHFEREVSIPVVLARLTAVGAPLLGGFLIVRLGFSALFNWGIVLVLASSLPLFLMPHHKHGPFPGWRHILAQTFKGKYFSLFLSFWGVRNVAIVAGIIWPVFLFGLAGDSYSELGLITSGVLLVSALAALLVGKFASQLKEKAILKLGAWINALVWLLKVLVQTPVAAFLTDSLNKLTDVLHVIPFDALTYKKALVKKHPSEFIIRREILLHFGGLISTLLMIFLWQQGVPLPAFFAFASVGYLASILLVAS